MDDRPRDDRHIEELLRRTGEQDAPVWLKQKIMQRVCELQPSLSQRLTSCLRHLLPLRLSPAGLVSVIVIGCSAFWGGILAERHSSDMKLQQAVDLTAFADNARANYLIGRGMLTGNRREAALGFFRKAVELEPESAEYVHWQGVAYWTTGNKELEKQSYVQTVQDHPDFVPSLLNLGHSYFESGNYSAALQYYQRVLQNDNHNPQALYNSALAYQRLDDAPQAIQFFKRYLQLSRTGKWAYRAVDHLHQLGDFIYRGYRIGVHRIILNVADLLHTGSLVQQKEVERIARAVNRTTRQELHIIAYNKEKKEQARATALDLRNQLLGQLDPEHGAPIMVSWFDAAETISSVKGDTLQLSPSILIFSNPLNAENRRNAT